MADVRCGRCGEEFESGSPDDPFDQWRTCPGCLSRDRISDEFEIGGVTFSLVMTTEEAGALPEAVFGSFMAPTALMKTRSWELLVEGAERHDGVTPRLVSWTDSLGLTYVAFASSLEEEAEIFTRALEGEYPDLWLEIEGEE